MANALSDYVAVVRDNPDFRKLYIGQTVSLFGDWFNFIAVQTLVYELTHSGLATGLAIITSTLPAFFLTPIAGSIADHFDRRKIMIVCDVARTFIALGMILVRTADQIWLIYLLMAVLVVFGSFFNPASSAALPNLVNREQLYPANALSNSTWGAMLAVGALTGGVMIALVGRDAAFVVNSLSFVVSAAMLFMIRRPFSGKSPARQHGLNPFADFVEGLQYARSRPPILAQLAVKSGGSLAAGVLLLLTLFALQVYQAGSVGIGMLQLARGIGILAGPVLAAPLVRGHIPRAEWVIGGGFLLAGVSYVLFGLTPTLLLGMPFVVLAHVGWGSNWSLSATVLQRLTPDSVRGRVFSMDIGLFTFTNALSTFFTGVATDAFSPRPVVLALGGVFLIYGLVWMAGVRLGRSSQPASWPDGSFDAVAPEEEAWVLD